MRLYSSDEDPYEAFQDDLDPHRQEERARAMRETSDRLRERGVLLTGHESSEELVVLLETVERFEEAVEARGGDLMVDEGPHGMTREPDDIHFVIPRRESRESVASYVQRLEERIQMLRHHWPHSS